MTHAGTGGTGGIGGTGDTGDTGEVRALVTGGAGFLGRGLTAALLARGDVARVDVVDTAGATTEPGDPRVHHHELDVHDVDALAALAGRAGTTAVFHLAAMVSAACEVDPAGAWRVNVEGTRAVLEVARSRGPGTRVVVTSSVAVFGPTGPGERVSDHTHQQPRSTYGMTKAVGELLVDDWTRQGWIDGRTARLPTVVVRPGRPNRAASGFASGMFREPLAGVDTVVPVPVGTPMCLIGARTAVATLVGLHDLPGAALGPGRAVGMPALEVTVADMVAALHRAGKRHQRALGRVVVRPDPAIVAVVASWPGGWDASRARALGLPADVDLDTVVDEHLAG